MIRFEALESLGLRVAAISDKSDGDCRLPAESNGFTGIDARRGFVNALGFPPEDLVCLRQVHGIAITTVSAKDRGRGGLDASTALADSDGIITAEPGLPIGVSVADCVPIVIYDPVVRAIGVVHAGRLGTMGNIAGHAVEALTTKLGSRATDLNAVIGPSAGPDRYEVSNEIAQEFAALGLPRRNRLLDLWGANRQQLEAAGIPAAQIHLSEICTIQDERFFSHRGDASGGRNLAVAVL